MNIEIVNIQYCNSVIKLKGERVCLRNVKNGGMKRCRVITSNNQVGVSYSTSFWEDDSILAIKALKNAQSIGNNNFNSKKLFYFDSSNVQYDNTIGFCRIRVIYDQKITMDRKINNNLVNQSEISQKIYGYTMCDSKYIHFFSKGNEQKSLLEEINPDHIVEDISLIENCVLTPNATLNFLHPYILNMLTSNKPSRDIIVPRNLNVFSRNSVSFDTEGFRTKEVMLIENGVVKNRISSFLFKKGQELVGFYGYRGLYLHNIDLIFSKILLNRSRFLLICSIEPINNTDIFLLRCVNKSCVSITICVRLLSIKKFLANCYSLGDLFYGENECRCAYCMLTNFYEVFDVLN